MASEWYYSLGTERKGPVPTNTLIQLARDGVVTPSTLVWKKGVKDWIPAAKVAGLFPSEEPPPLPAGAKYEPTPGPSTNDPVSEAKKLTEPPIPKMAYGAIEPISANQAAAELSEIQKASASSTESPKPAVKIDGTVPKLHSLPKTKRFTKAIYVVCAVVIGAFFLPLIFHGPVSTRVQPAIPCPQCGGSGASCVCWYCAGSGFKRDGTKCGYCNGRGVNEPCSYCGGSGQKTAAYKLYICPLCNGLGTSLTPCPRCDGSGIDPTGGRCSSCKGSKLGNCPKCDGTGKAYGP
jgi:hypothetical protein